MFDKVLSGLVITLAGVLGDADHTISRKRSLVSRKFLLINIGLSVILSAVSDHMSGWVSESETFLKTASAIFFHLATLEMTAVAIQAGFLYQSPGIFYIVGKVMLVFIYPQLKVVWLRILYPSVAPWCIMLDHKTGTLLGWLSQNFH